MQINWDFNEEQIKFAKEKLISGFEEQKSFGAISSHMIEELERKYDGSWLCLVKPAQMQLGLSFHSSAQLILQF